MNRRTCTRGLRVPSSDTWTFHAKLGQIWSLLVNAFNLNILQFMHIHTYRRMLLDNNRYRSVMQDLPSSGSMKRPAGIKHLSTHQVYFEKQMCADVIFLLRLIYPVNCRRYLPEKKMVPRPKRIRAARMHLLTENPLSTCCRGSWKSSSFSSSSSALPILSRVASRDLLLLLSCGPSSPAATSDASVEPEGAGAWKTLKSFALSLKRTTLVCALFIVWEWSKYHSTLWNSPQV